MTRRGGSGVPFARSQFKRTFSSDIRRPRGGRFVLRPPLG
ncbi:MAG: hypothetical protein HSCHL_2332 [Hydrogenibacillus schlegelii]|uniref:Uncharacterized protein n=1 Tax=Hydrogenibacillus schlegelii TaxID=1484 RepID=A0A2T5GEY0_HYDSH|nr:MAG: hypothetical protein HSCHL_2332 [Hydrogenibacillus schlegelii]